MWRLAVGGLVMAAACSDPAPAPQPSEDALVLDLGAPNASLQGALRSVAVKQGRSVPAAPPTVLGGADSVDSASGDWAEGEPSAVDPQAPGSRDFSSPPADEEFRSAVLGEGETISELTQKHLGTSRRWQEVLELNGWTEDEARRLRVGTTVRLPAN